MEHFVVGRSPMCGVALGDELLSTMHLKYGFGYDFFQVGEVVGVRRSDGICTIAQVRKLCPEFAILNLGNGREKEITGIEIATSMGKLIGPYCVTHKLLVYLPGTCRPVASHRAGDPVSGEKAFLPTLQGRQKTIRTIDFKDNDGSNIFPIFPGQDCEQLPQRNGFPIDSYFVGEPVSVQNQNARICGIVTEVMEDTMYVAFSLEDWFAPNQSRKHSIPASKVSKLLDRHYVPQAENDFPRIKIGRTKFYGMCLGCDTGYLNRLNNIDFAHYWVNELVSLKSPDGSRMLSLILEKHADGGFTITTGKDFRTIEPDSMQTLSKVEGCLYVVDAVRSAPVTITCVGTIVTVGETVIRSLCLGQDTSALHQRCYVQHFKPGEAVSVSRGHGLYQAAAVVEHDAARGITLDLGEELRIFVDHAQLPAVVGKLRGHFHIVHPLSLAPSAPEEPTPIARNEWPALRVRVPHAVNVRVRASVRVLGSSSLLQPPTPMLRQCKCSVNA